MSKEKIGEFERKARLMSRKSKDFRQVNAKPRFDTSKPRGKLPVLHVTVFSG